MKFSMNRKLLFKVIAGFLLIAAAFIIYFGKNINNESDWIEITNAETNTEINNESQDEKLNENEDPTENEQINIQTIVIEMAGEVNSPSVYILPEGSRVYQGIEAAGGITKNADTRNTNLAAVLYDGIKLYIPSKKEVQETEKQTGIKAGSDYIDGSTAISSTAGGSKTSKINLNKATITELQQLKGVGPATAEKILQYRNDYGSFEKTEELINVSGIGEKTYEKLKDMITVE